MKDSKSYLYEYLHSVENEICNDIRAYELNFAQAKDYSYLPRPNKWLNKYGKRQKMIRFAGSILFQFWLFGGAIIYFSYKLVINLFNSVGVKNQKDEIFKLNEFALGFSERSFKVINEISIGRIPQSWIVLPWVNIKCDPYKNIFSLFSILDLQDFVRAWLLSVRSVFLLYTTKSTSPSLLQGYTAYHWFLTRLGFTKLKKGHFITAEHLDRWILLIDSVIHQLKFDGHHQVSLTIVQHGVLEDLSAPIANSDAIKLNVKNKLYEVNTIYVYDQKSADILQQSILAASCRPEVFYFKPQIILQKTKLKNNHIRILFVGHPLCEKLQVFVMTELEKKYSVQAFYKPHPINSSSQAAELNSWLFISDKTYFPEVDLLVSYPSTLVVEYANQNIPALVHPINLSICDSGEYLQQLILKISKILL